MNLKPVQSNLWGSWFMCKKKSQYFCTTMSGLKFAAKFKIALGLHQFVY